MEKRKATVAIKEKGVNAVSSERHQEDPNFRKGMNPLHTVPEESQHSQFC